MKLLDERGLTTVWAAIKNTFTSKSDADEKYAKKSEGVKAIRLKKTQTGDDGAMSQLIHVIKADDGQNFLSIYNADNRMDGFMSKEDKVKLDGIASGANNYTLPVASADTLGGIKASSPYIGGYNFPISVDKDNKAYTRISGLDRGERGGGITQVAVDDDDDTNFSTKYTRDKITVYRNTEGEASLRFPFKSGTLALISDIPTKTSQLTNDSGFLTPADKYTLPVASQNTLGGILSFPVSGSPDNFWPIIVSQQAIAYTNIAGLNKSSNGDITSIIVKNNGYSTTYTATSIQKQKTGNNLSAVLNIPDKFGTLALTSDIPNVSNLCRFNFVNSISECKSDRINFLLRHSGALIDLDPFDVCPDGTILIISVSSNSVQIKHQSGSWFFEGDEVNKDWFTRIYKENLKLITIYEGKVHYYSL